MPAVHRLQMDKMLAGVRAAGLKLTPQRMAIVRELADDESHPTAQELYERLRPSLPTMSFATVYNTLDALTTAGLCAALSLAPGSGRFDPNMEPHHHLVCDGCGSVRDIPNAVTVAAASPEDNGDNEDNEDKAEDKAEDKPEDRADESVRRAISRTAPGFEIRSIERIMRGLCADCARSRPRPTGRREKRETPRGT